MVNAPFHTTTHLWGTARRALVASLLGAAALTGFTQSAPSPTPLRVMVHSSFSLPKPLLAKFETDNNIKLQITKGGDAGEMLNKLILTRANPIADVVFGIDNTLVAKASAADILVPYTGPASQRQALTNVGLGLVPVDFGFVTINVDAAGFAKTGLALPQSLEDLAKPAYKDLLVVQNPATSSTGFAFLLATIAGLGEGPAFDWWAKMRRNGLKVSKGWTEAYYTEFSRNGGRYPLVVSYASSPAAEVFYSKEKLSRSPTSNLFFKGGVWQQVEGVALIKGGDNTAAAGRFVEFLRSSAVQEGLQTTMWMLPVEANIARADVLRFTTEPRSFETMALQDIDAKGPGWVQRFSRTVLK
jgi:thiamine transport system substrate-binding protein